MGAYTGIQWTESSWNPVTGCSPVSAGCAHCYAAAIAHRFSGNRRYAGLTNSAGRFNGRVRLHDDTLEVPIRWQRGRMVFVCSVSDLFHPDVPFEFIDCVWAVMALCSQHTFQVLTKRSERLLEYLRRLENDPRSIAEEIVDAMEALYLAGRLNVDLGEMQAVYDEHNWPLRNVWCGVTVENQEAGPRVDELLACPAAVRFVSCEPLLGSVDQWDYLWPLIDDGGDLDGAEERRAWGVSLTRPALDWVICGGESGPGARPMRVGWARSLRDQCQAAGVPFFFKQWGGWCRVDQLPPEYRIAKSATRRRESDGVYVRLSKKWSGRRLDGELWDEWPGTGLPAGGQGTQAVEVPG